MIIMNYLLLDHIKVLDLDWSVKNKKYWINFELIMY